MSAHMKSGSLRFEFEVEMNRNILVLIQLTELIIVNVLKTCKNLEGTCHLLFFVDVLRQHACQLLNSLSMYFYYFIQNIGMYDVCMMVTCLYFE